MMVKNLTECQASSPARAPGSGLGPVIRMACMAGEIVANACISLRSVEQSGNGRVKKPGMALEDWRAVAGWQFIASYLAASYLREEN